MHDFVSYGCAAPVREQLESGCFAQVLRSSMHPGNDCMYMRHKLRVFACAFRKGVTESHYTRVETGGPGMLSSLVSLVIANRLLAQLEEAS